jgi:hypothetical protein
MNWLKIFMADIVANNTNGNDKKPTYKTNVTLPNITAGEYNIGIWQHAGYLTLTIEQCVVDAAGVATILQDNSGYLIQDKDGDLPALHIFTECSKEQLAKLLTTERDYIIEKIV